MDINAIQKPTLIIRPEVAKANISVMARKAQKSGVVFRPHFKTHQSNQVGEWFRSEGVSCITVSSVEMAAYFSAHGWSDILIAFTANRREWTTINQLAAKSRLGLLVEDLESIRFFQQHLEHPVDIWLEADNGLGRTGIPVGEVENFIKLAKEVHSPFVFKGLLTHAGNAYHIESDTEAKQIYQDTLENMTRIKEALVSAGFNPSISYGDTPTLSRVEDVSGWDEIRPGNFVFFDCTQYQLGSCRQEDIAVGVACPVMAVYPQRRQLVLYGGGVHLSKDYFISNGRPCYGFVCKPDEQGWGALIQGAEVSALWQEHAMVDMNAADLQTIKTGDLLVVLPSHSCMTVDLYDEYLTPGGEKLPIRS